MQWKKTPLKTKIGEEVKNQKGIPVVAEFLGSVLLVNDGRPAWASLYVTLFSAMDTSER